MNLAAPALRVSSPNVKKAPTVEKASATPARPRVPATASPAPVVEPAAIIDYSSSSAGQEKDGGDTNNANADNTTRVSAAVLRDSDGGVDFESYAAVLPGEMKKKNVLQKVLPFLFDERDYVSYGEAVRYICIKRQSCFVYIDNVAASPLYAIPLDDTLVMEIENSSKPDYYSVTVSPSSSSSGGSKNNLITVLLRHCKSKNIAFQFTFDRSKDESVVKRFCGVLERMTVRIATKAGETEKRKK